MLTVSQRVCLRVMRACVTVCVPSVTCDAVHLSALQHSIGQACMQEQPRITTASLVSSMAVEHQ